MSQNERDRPDPSAARRIVSMIAFFQSQFLSRFSTRARAELRAPAAALAGDEPDSANEESAQQPPSPLPTPLS